MKRYKVLLLWISVIFVFSACKNKSAENVINIENTTHTSETIVSSENLNDVDVNTSVIKLDEKEFCFVYALGSKWFLVRDNEKEDFYLIDHNGNLFGEKNIVNYGVNIGQGAFYLVNRSKDAKLESYLYDSDCNKLKYLGYVDKYFKVLSYTDNMLIMTNSNAYENYQVFDGDNDFKLLFKIDPDKHKTQTVYNCVNGYISTQNSLSSNMYGYILCNIWGDEIKLNLNEKATESLTPNSIDNWMELLLLKKGAANSDGTYKLLNDGYVFYNIDTDETIPFDGEKYTIECINFDGTLVPEWNDMCVVKDNESNSKKVINFKTGQILFENFSNINLNEFETNRMLISIENKYGYVDKEFNILHMYEKATTFSNDVAVVYENDGYYVINANFEKVSDKIDAKAVYRIGKDSFALKQENGNYKIFCYNN